MRQVDFWQSFTTNPTTQMKQKEFCVWLRTYCYSALLNFGLCGPFSSNTFQGTEFLRRCHIYIYITYVYAHIYTYIYIHMNICLHIYIYTSIYIYTYIYMYMYMSIYVYMYRHSSTYGSKHKENKIIYMASSY